MPDHEDIEIVGDVPTATEPRSSVLTLEIPILPAPRTKGVDLEQEREAMLAYVAQADASLAVLQVATQMLTQHRDLARARALALYQYLNATAPDDSDPPIPF